MARTGKQHADRASALPVRRHVVSLVLLAAAVLCWSAPRPAQAQGPPIPGRAGVVPDAGPLVPFWKWRENRFVAVPAEFVLPGPNNDPTALVQPGATMPMCWEQRPLAHCPLWLLPEVLFRHGDPNDPGRHIGWGQPLEGTSWLNRPLHADFFFGGLWGDAVIGGRLDLDDDLIGGYRFGRDFDHYWGWEARFAFSYLDVLDGVTAPRVSNANINFWDAHLLYYPWGDARWRPYATAGIGIAHYRLHDEFDTRHTEVLLHLPFGVGMKYQLKRWLALRVDVLDNFTIGGGGLDPMHNLSLTFGAEVHFGGDRTLYFPSNPGSTSF